jgi:hypothetical protein
VPTACEHRCCHIPANPYHTHAQPPERCERCAGIDPEPHRAAVQVIPVIEVVPRTAAVAAALARFLAGDRVLRAERG